MPREIKAYACKYRCGQRINTKKEAMILHENICFLNTDRKACKTCEHWLNRDNGICVEGHLKESEYATYDCKFYQEAQDF